MTDINSYINDLEAQQAIKNFLAIKDDIPKICNVILKLSQIDNTYFEKELNKQKILENSVNSSKTETCSPTTTIDTNTIKESV